MTKNKKIEVQGLDIIVYHNMEEDFMSLTDIARFKPHYSPSSSITVSIYFKIRHFV